MKKKTPKKRNPIAKQASKMRTKVKPGKKKRNPPDGGLSYNKQPLLDGVDY